LEKGEDRKGIASSSNLRMGKILGNIGLPGNLGYSLFLGLFF
jgi:hypothetical protein